MNTTSYGECECGCGQPAPVARQTDRRKGYVKGEPMRFISGHNKRGGPMPTRSCARCGDDFQLKYRTSEQEFCSRECSRSARREGLTDTRPWTDTEMGELLDLDGVSAREAGEILGRTAQAVQHMRTKLAEGWEQQRFAWTEDEIDFVRRTPHFTADQVARHLGRTYDGVAGIRLRLRNEEGADFGQGGKDPSHVGPRRLLAKTCLGCGLLLEASWFSMNDRGRAWRTRCNRCAHQEASERHPDRPTTAQKDGGRSARTSRERLQALTRERATRHGEPWLEADQEVLRDPDLSIFEKATRLGRTWSATQTQVSKNGYTSRVGKGDPMKGVWVIDNPNAPVAA